MRCNNCGWSNEPSAQRCEKCNAPLKGSMIGTEDDSVKKSFKRPVEEEIPKGTLPESQTNDGDTSCPRCGYNVAPYMQKCPICQTPVSHGDYDANEPQVGIINRQRTHIATINPWENGISQNKSFICQLQPIAWEGENIKYQPISYVGSNIVLNRANTDPNNQTITSKTQASLTYENGDWFIENLSEHKSTFIQVNNKMKLSNGDIIVLGNRLFVFHEK